MTPLPTEAIVTPFPTRSPVMPPPVNRCGLTAAEHRSQIVDNLSVISFPDLFDEPSTPQRLALDWIVDEDSAQVCPDEDNLVQRYVMAVFYYSTNGDAWTKCSAPEEFKSQASIDAANRACTLTT